jgi:hypothetical protein
MNNYAIKTITAATNEPIDKTEAKLHMAIDDTTFDDLIEEYQTIRRSGNPQTTGDCNV